MHQRIGSALVQIMAYHLFGAQPLSEPMLEWILLIRPLETNFSENRSKIQTFSFTKTHLKMSSAKWWPFCSGGDDLSHYTWRNGTTICRTVIWFVKISMFRWRGLRKYWFVLNYQLMSQDWQRVGSKDLIQMELQCFNIRNAIRYDIARPNWKHSR